MARYSSKGFPVAARLPRIAAVLLLALACLPARAEYWEAPETIAEGRFPSFFAAKAGPLLLWQESQSAGEAGKARIRFARFEGGRWLRGDVSDSSYAYSSSGAPPILYSAAESRGGTIAVAIAASGTSIEVKLSRDGGRSFTDSGRLESATTSVAPRIYPSASGGWIIFATQGRAGTTTAAAAPTGEAGATASEASIQLSSVSIYVARSADGASWSRFEPLVGEDEKLPMNFAPFASPLGSKDLVVFQTFILGEGDQSSRYALISKLSSDGGATWTRAKVISDFDADAASYDNQGPQLVLAGGKLYAAWERRKAKTTQTQVWAARIDDSGSIDPKSAQGAQGASGSFMLSELLESGGRPSILAREDKLKANRVLLSSMRKDGQWSSEDTDLAGRGDKAGSGLVTFARALDSGNRTFVAWQLDTIDKSRILAMVPDASVDPPALAPLNFIVGKRSRAESAEVKLNMPEDASGIKDYAYIWKKTPDKAASVPAPAIADIWKTGVKGDAPGAGIALGATEDGAWTLWVSIEDKAGNRSVPAALSYYRKRIPPPAPIVIPPDLDERGFLASSSFAIRWIPPEADDIAGYTWDFAYAGPLEEAARPQAAVKAPAKASAAAPPPLPGLSPYESSLVRALGNRLPPPGLRGTKSAFSADNVDNGYYLFSVSAIDTTGNIGGAASVFLRADKYKPYTIVVLADSSRDDLGRSVLRLLGRGFLADGRIERVALSRSGRAPYEVDRSLDRGEYRITSDRELVGLTFDDVQAGNYRIGLYHSTRGWYWTSPILSIDSSGTVKYGLLPAYAPGFRLFTGLAKDFSIYDAMVLMAMLFAAFGILLASRQVFALAREGEFVRREAIALVTGGPMPQAQTKKTARELKRRGTGLRAKFTITIALLVIFVVLLLSIFLGYNMIRRTSQELATGLDQRARVLLESVAQGGRFFMGKEDAVTQLSLFPSQARAMKSATYITITGDGPDPKVAMGEVVYATNDPGIVGKLEAATLNVDRAIVLGKSVLKAEEGIDPLARLVPAKAKDLGDKAAFVIADQLQLKARLAQEKAGLKAGAAGNQRRSEINAELDAIDLRIRDKLATLSDQEVGSLPGFDPAVLAAMPPSYLYYKPIIEYRPSDSLLYRGMVRLEVSTAQITSEVRSATVDLVRLTLIIAAIALGAGIAGAFILSTVIVVPIRKLVAQIEKIRDTEDKADLEGSRIEVASRDELYTLASTVNEMTNSLVFAAKASKELTVGKGIQKMFIPLSLAPGNASAKLSTGRIDGEGFEVFGYYEGAKGVSGDYWDFRAINNRYHYFIKCDISGKGVSAALIMVEVATMVINYFSKWSQLFPTNIDLTPLVYQINDFINEMKYKGRFAAFTVGVLDAKTGVAHLCDAGDTKLNVWSARQRKLITESLPNSPAAGPFDSSLVQMKGPYKQVTRPLEPGDVLMLYTDGIEEAKRIIRNAESRPIECEMIMDPALVFAGYLRDYFNDDRFQLRELTDPSGSPLFSGTDAGAFAGAFAGALALGLAEISTDRITSVIRDRAVSSVVAATMSELEHKLAATKGKPGGWLADDAGVLAIATGAKVRSALQQALEAAYSDMRESARAAYIAKPDPSFLTASFPDRFIQGLSDLGSKLINELAQALEKRHHELDKEHMIALLREGVSEMSGKALEAAGPRLRDRLASILASSPASDFASRPEQAHLCSYLLMPPAELASLLSGAIEGPCSPKAVAEIARVPSSAASMKRFTDKLINSPVYHDHHKVGTDNEEFGQERIAAVLDAVDSRSSYTLVHDHAPLPPGSLTFDFSKCSGSLEEKVIALTAVEKVFRLWRDESTTWRDQIVIDEKIDDFLKDHFDQYRLYFSSQRPYYDPEKNNPGYRIYSYLREDEQYDDLTILAIRRK